MEFKLPATLTRLITAGIWPSRQGPSLTEQESNPIVLADRVRRFAPDESLIILHPPPFSTIAWQRDGDGIGKFWQQFGALEQINAEQALIIGDFGMGSDSPIILEFSRNPSNPPVLRLWWTWSPDASTRWVQGARDFDEFAEMLGLTQEVD